MEEEKMKKSFNSKNHTSTPRKLSTNRKSADSSNNISDDSIELPSSIHSDVPSGFSPSESLLQKIVRQKKVKREVDVYMISSETELSDVSAVNFEEERRKLLERSLKYEDFARQGRVPGPKQLEHDQKRKHTRKAASSSTNGKNDVGRCASAAAAIVPPPVQDKNESSKLKESSSDPVAQKSNSDVLLPPPQPQYPANNDAGSSNDLALAKSVLHGKPNEFALPLRRATRKKESSGSDRPLHLRKRSSTPGSSGSEILTSTPSHDRTKHFGTMEPVTPIVPKIKPLKNLPTDPKPTFLKPYGVSTRKNVSQLQLATSNSGLVNITDNSKTLVDSNAVSESIISHSKHSGISSLATESTSNSGITPWDFKRNATKQPQTTQQKLLSPSEGSGSNKLSSQQSNAELKTPSYSLNEGSSSIRNSDFINIESSGTDPDTLHEDNDNHSSTASPSSKPQSHVQEDSPMSDSHKETEESSDEPAKKKRKSLLKRKDYLQKTASYSQLMKTNITSDSSESESVTASSSLSESSNDDEGSELGENPMGDGPNKSVTSPTNEGEIQSSQILSDPISKRAPSSSTSSALTKTVNNIEDHEMPLLNKSVGYTKPHSLKSATPVMSSNSTKKQPQEIKKIMDPISKPVVTPKSVKTVSNLEDDNETFREKTVGYTKHNTRKSVARAALDESLPDKATSSKSTKQQPQASKKIIDPVSKAAPSPKSSSLKTVGNNGNSEDSFAEDFIGFSEPISPKFTRSKLQSQLVPKIVDPISKAVGSPKSTKTVSSFKNDKETFREKTVGYPIIRLTRKSATRAALDDSPPHNATSSKSTKVQPQAIKKTVDPTSKPIVSSKSAETVDQDEKTVGYTKHQSRKSVARATLYDSPPHKRVTRATSSKSTKDKPQAIKNIVNPISNTVPSPKLTKTVSSSVDDKETTVGVGYTKHNTRQSVARAALDESLPDKATSSKSTKQQPQASKKIMDPVSKAAPSPKSSSLKTVGNNGNSEDSLGEDFVGFSEPISPKSTRSTKLQPQLIPKIVDPISKAMGSPKSTKTVSSFKNDKETFREKTVGYPTRLTRKSATHATLDDSPPHNATSSKSTKEQPQAIKKIVDPVSKAAPSPKSVSVKVDNIDDSEDPLGEDFIGFSQPSSQKSTRSTKLQPQAIQRLAEHIDKATLTPKSQVSNSSNDSRKLLTRKRRKNTSYTDTVTMTSTLSKHPSAIYSDFISSYQQDRSLATATTNPSLQNVGSSIPKFPSVAFPPISEEEQQEAAVENIIGSDLDSEEEAAAESSNFLDNKGDTPSGSPKPSTSKATAAPVPAPTIKTKEELRHEMEEAVKLVDPDIFEHKDIIKKEKIDRFAKVLKGKVLTEDQLDFVHKKANELSNEIIGKLLANAKLPGKVFTYQELRAALLEHNLIHDAPWEPLGEMLSCWSTTQLKEVSGLLTPDPDNETVYDTFTDW